MRERLIELLDMDCGYVSEMKAEELADYLFENGVVVLPCRVGDIVYQTDGVRVYESRVSEIVYYTPTVAFDGTAVGKSIFLTREEAEKALEGGARR